MKSQFLRPDSIFRCWRAAAPLGCAAAIFFQEYLPSTSQVLGEDTTKVVATFDSEAPATKAVTHLDSWRDIHKCGINSAYSLLKLRGKEISYEELVEQIGVGLNGSSLKDICDALQVHDLETQVVQTTIAGLSEMGLPAIAHMDEITKDSYDLLSRGHYIVVLRIDPTKVHYIDGSTGALLEMPIQRFVSEWSQYAIVDKTSRLETHLLFMAIALAAFFVSYRSTKAVWKKKGRVSA